MNEQVKKRLTKADTVLIISLVALTVFLFLRPVIFASATGGYFTVTTPDGTTTHSLSDEGEFEVRSAGFTLRLTVKDGKVAVTDSDCPDGICKSTGDISRVGEAIVCVPAQTVIRIGEGGASDEDFIVG